MVPAPVARRARQTAPDVPLPSMWARSRQPIPGLPCQNLKHVGWALFQPTVVVNWCGHAQEIIALPLADGRVTFVPVLGEAR